MNDTSTNAPGTGPTTIYCPQCGEAMLVRPQHLETRVACPNCRETLEPWRLAATVQMPDQPRQSRQNYGDPPPRPIGYSHRNRWVAGTLGVLLGPFGVHRFYLGFTGIGLLQVLRTVGSIFILTPVVAIWTVIEGILCFCGAMNDVDGLPLRK